MIPATCLLQGLLEELCKGSRALRSLRDDPVEQPHNGRMRIGSVDLRGSVSCGRRGISASRQAATTPLREIAALLRHKLERRSSYAVEVRVGQPLYGGSTHVSADAFAVTVSQHAPGQNLSLHS